MKKLLAMLALFVIVCSISPANANGYTVGAIYEDTVEPVAVGTAAGFSKTGVSECKNVFNIVQWGDCSIQQAVKQGRIKDIHHVDVHRDGSFIFKKIYTNVYGN